jgi:hypothetical protein
MLGTENIDWIPISVLAGLLLLYPIKTRDVHPIVQFAICATLTAVGLYLALSALVGSSESSMWVLLASSILALPTVIVPAVGALVGLATAFALVVNAIASTFLPHFWCLLVTGLAAVGGASILVVEKEMFLHWQLIAPPIVGGYLAAIAASAFIDNEWYLYGIWASTCLLSVLLHIRRRRVNTWLDRKRDVAVRSKESQIVSVMRSANPEMNADDFEKLKEKLLGAVDGDREQVDRIVFGGGLY